MKLKLLLPVFLLATNAYAFDPNAGVDAQPQRASCVRNNYCNVYSSHFASFINKTNTPKIIYVTYGICPQNEECRSDTYQIKVNPGTWHDTKRMSYEAKYHFPGDFRLWATTTIADSSRHALNTIRREAKIQVHG